MAVATNNSYSWWGSDGTAADIWAAATPNLGDRVNSLYVRDNYGHFMEVGWDWGFTRKDVPVYMLVYRSKYTPNGEAEEYFWDDLPADPDPHIHHMTRGWVIVPAGAWSTYGISVRPGTTDYDCGFNGGGVYTIWNLAMSGNTFSMVGAERLAQDPNYGNFTKLMLRYTRADLRGVWDWWWYARDNTTTHPDPSYFVWTNHLRDANHWLYVNPTEKP